MTSIVSVATQKGGVGKTTTTLGLAGAVAATGRRVLVIDMDPQFNASETLLADYHDRKHADDFFSTNDLLEPNADPAELGDYIQPTPWANVDLIPSEDALANRNTDLAPGIELRLRRMLSKGLPTLQVAYDVVLIDCPPAADSRPALNAFLASQRMLLVSGPDFFGNTALNAVFKTLGDLDTLYGHALDVAGLIVNMYENTNEAIRRTNALRDQYGEKLLLVMPKRTVISVAAGSHQSVFSMSRSDAREVAEKYTELATKMALFSESRGILDTVAPVSETRPEIVDAAGAWDNGHPDAGTRAVGS